MMALAANSIEGKAENYRRRIKNIKDDIASLKGACGAACKERRADIGEIFVEAKDNGVPVKSLKQFIKYCELEERKQALGAGLDIDESAVYKTLIETLGELGAAAARAKGYTVDPKDQNVTLTVNDDDRDFRPPHLRTHQY